MLPGPRPHRLQRLHAHALTAASPGPWHEGASGPQPRGWLCGPSVGGTAHKLLKQASAQPGSRCPCTWPLSTPTSCGRGRLAHGRAAGGGSEGRRAAETWPFRCLPLVSLAHQGFAMPGNLQVQRPRSCVPTAALGAPRAGLSSLRSWLVRNAAPTAGRAQSRRGRGRQEGERHRPCTPPAPPVAVAGEVAAARTLTALSLRPEAKARTRSRSWNPLPGPRSPRAPRPSRIPSRARSARCPPNSQRLWERKSLAWL